MSASGQARRSAAGRCRGAGPSGGWWLLLGLLEYARRDGELDHAERVHGSVCAYGERAPGGQVDRVDGGTGLERAQLAAYLCL